jgi:hypothetical protein
MSEAVGTSKPYCAILARNCQLQRDNEMDGAVGSRDLRSRELNVRYATTFPEAGHLNADLTRRRWLPDAWQRVSR